MQRTKRTAWRRILVQSAVLAGLGLVFVGGDAELAAEPPEFCKAEGICTYKKPMLLIALEYGAAMNGPFDADTTRWEAATTGISAILDADNGFMASTFHVGLMRYGHDPDPQNWGTKIGGDVSGLVDGFKIDAPLYDEGDPNQPYVECDGADRIDAALAGVPPPGDFEGAWTRGALVFAGAYLDEVLAVHPEPERLAMILLVTQGVWTNVTGTNKVGPPQEDPVPVAQALYADKEYPTYVVALGAGQGKMLADQLAAAGGTFAAYAELGQALVDAYKLVIQELISVDYAYPCTQSYPRIMVLLDGGSGMLNVGADHAPAGQGGWEQARAVLALDGLFAAQTSHGAIADATHVGLVVYGDDAPQEEQLVVQYGLCRADNLAWALDPETSCAEPGCSDPYAAPPIAWTFKDSMGMPPLFDDLTVSHMPRCEAEEPLPNACAGSGSFVHRGLELVVDNLEVYKADCQMPQSYTPCSDGTVFRNVLITDGLWDSTDAQVQAPLVAMHAAGVTTYVLAAGDLAETPAAQAGLAKLADWGSGGTLDPFKMANQAELEAVLVELVDAAPYHPCCGFDDCAVVPEPTTSEPDPLPVQPDPDTGGSSGGVDASEGSSGGGSSGGSSGESSGGSASTSGSTGEDTGTTEGTGTTANLSGVSAGETAVDTGSGGDVPTTGASADAGSSGGAEEVSEGGCACATGSAPAGVLWLLGLVGVGRRRSRAGERERPR